MDTGDFGLSTNSSQDVKGDTVMLPLIPILAFLFLSTVVFSPAVILFAGYLFLKRRKDRNYGSQALKNDIVLIKEELREIKEQIADFVIRTY
jgi:hypothetical protein